MQIDEHLDRVRTQIRAAAALGDERTRQIADGLADATAAAVHLALIEAVSAAADEITAALLDVPGSPAVRVVADGRDIAFDIHQPAVTPEPEPTPRDDGDVTARISLRLPESVKAGVDAAAEREGVSVNTWLVRAAAAALPDRRPGAGPRRGPQASTTQASTTQTSTTHLSGWLNG